MTDPAAAAGPSRAESIAGAAKRVDDLDVEAVVDLASQPAHQDLEHVRERIVVLIPYVRGDGGAVDDLVAMADQELEERELLGRQLDGPTAPPDAMGAQIHLEIVDGRDFRQRGGPAARESVEAGHELAKAEE